MPAKSEKQRRFFFATKACKEGGKCSAATRKAAKSLSTKQIKDFTAKKSAKVKTVKPFKPYKRKKS